MSYKTAGIKHTDSFLDIIAKLDKVQRTKETHNMTSEEVKKCIVLYTLAKLLGKAVFVEFHSCYSIKGFKYKRFCVHFILNPEGGNITIHEAPEMAYGRGNRYKISIVDPFRPKEEILKLFPEFTEEESGSITYLILTGE